MKSNLKPGGGNKPQPYIPAGNGRESGQYTNTESQQRNRKTFVIRNKRFKYNSMKSKLVRNVSDSYVAGLHVSIPINHKPNSVIKKTVNGVVRSERYFDEKGNAYLDIDYTDHGNPYTHPVVPHIHRWNKDKDGKIKRGQWEVFQ